MSQTAIQRLIKIAAFGLLVVATVCIELFMPLFFSELYTLLKTGHVQKVADYLASYEMLAVFLSIYANTLINILGFPPSIVMSAANGVTFGVIAGTIITWIAECLGTILGFIIMKTFLRPTAQKLVKKSRHLRKAVEDSGSNGFKIVLFLRMMPYFPAVVTTALAAVSNISLRNYISATIIGKFPATAIEVLVGHDLIDYRIHGLRLTLVSVSVVIFYVAGILAIHRSRKSRGD
ncbi:MAG: VTT domain-containing protein [Bacillota bacterium]